MKSITKFNMLILSSSTNRQLMHGPEGQNAPEVKAPPVPEKAKPQDPNDFSVKANRDRVADQARALIEELKKNPQGMSENRSAELQATLNMALENLKDNEERVAVLTAAGLEDPAREARENARRMNARVNRLNLTLFPNETTNTAVATAPAPKKEVPRNERTASLPGHFAAPSEEGPARKNNDKAPVKPSETPVANLRTIPPATLAQLRQELVQGDLLEVKVGEYIGRRSQVRGAIRYYKKS